jgi:microcystin-dependent protein
MPDTYTPNLNLVLPEIGASRDSWGTKLNANTTTIDQFLGMAMPIGAILDFAGPNAPEGWLICDGRLVSRTTYAALFAVIGTFWGAGDGSTTFALPNTPGRASVGPGTLIDQAGVSYGFSFTETVGFVTNTITQANLPNYALYCDVQGNHNHAGADTPAGGHSHTTDVQGQHNHGTNTTTESNLHTHYAVTDAQGAHAHNYLQFYEFPGSGVGSGSPAFANQNAQTDVQGNHAHNVSVGTESAYHVHGIALDGNHAHNISYVGDHQHGIYYDGAHSHNVYLNGSGVALEVLSPILVVTKIIYAGQEATTFVAAAAVTTIEGFAEQDELAAIRGELAALRALFAPALRQRVLSAPLRGTH